MVVMTTARLIILTDMVSTIVDQISAMQPFNRTRLIEKSQTLSRLHSSKASFREKERITGSRELNSTTNMLSWEGFKRKIMQERLITMLLNCFSVSIVEKMKI